MEGIEFLKVAEKFKASNDEDERRTSVSRSYYAIFNQIKTHFHRHKIRIPDNYEAHGKIYKYLHNCGIGEIEQHAKSFQSLRKDRNQADYEMDNSRFNKNTCNLIFAKAQLIIGVFNKQLNNVDFFGAIQEYKNKTGDP